MIETMPRTALQALIGLIEKWRERGNICDPTYLLARKDCADQLVSLLSILSLPAATPQRCPEKWANFNQCVRPFGHTESHLTDAGADWRVVPQPDTPK